MKEPLGPVDDPVLDPAISQETLSKKVRVGLEYLARVAREWPETASKGENVDEKRRFERRRGQPLFFLVQFCSIYISFCKG